MKQVTVFLENKEGHLSDLVNAVSNSGANMKALTIADTSAYGLVRILAADADKAIEALEGAGYRASITNVLGVRLPNETGSLAKLLGVMQESQVSIEYAYCFENSDGALAVLKVRDLNSATDAAHAYGMEIVDSL